MLLERPAEPPPGPIEILRGLSLTHATNAVIGFTFAASGPMAIILAAGAKGRLSEAEITSWIFGALFANGILSLLFSIVYRMPLVFFWTIPGAVLVGPALANASYAEVIGAFLVAGALMLVLGLLGLVRRVMAALPLPVVMGMVAGVFLPFGIDWLRAIKSELMIAGPMTLAFVAASSLSGRFARLPPLIAALAVGLATLYGLHGLPAADSELTHIKLVTPLLHVPAFSLTVLFELVVPLVITVLVVQNGQGVAILTAQGHQPPVNAIATGCGLWSMLIAPLGTVSTCLTGPVNAILSGSGRAATQYTAGIMVGLLAIGFGLIAPTFTKAMLAAPPAFIATLAGLAMLRVLQAAFVAAFARRFTLSALTAFLVSVAAIPVFNVGAPFWGLVAGFIVARTIERDDFDRSASPSGQPRP
ncbi:MAG: benzoate/H(+) symporter BenE family transporter [Hyphomicrobiaceae bacterium]